MKSIKFLFFVVTSFSWGMALSSFIGGNALISHKASPVFILYIIQHYWYSFVISTLITYIVYQPIFRSNPKITYEKSPEETIKNFVQSFQVKQELRNQKSLAKNIKRINRQYKKYGIDVSKIFTCKLSERPKRKSTIILEKDGYKIIECSDVFFRKYRQFIVREGKSFCSYEDLREAILEAKNGY